MRNVIISHFKCYKTNLHGHNVPVGQVALNWSTQKEYVGTALVGVRSIEHADENCKTFDWKLTEEEMKILDSKIEECAL